MGGEQRVRSTQVGVWGSDARIASSMVIDDSVVALWRRPKFAYSQYLRILNTIDLVHLPD